MYRADLTAIAITGPVDLRVHAEDTAGNTAELRLEPALVIGGTSRERAVKH
jgi:hypothetical protein